MRARSEVWDDEAHVERLEELWAEGLSAERIASRLSIEFGARITRSAILGKISRLRARKSGSAPVSRLGMYANNSGGSGWTGKSAAQRKAERKKRREADRAKRRAEEEAKVKVAGLSRPVINRIPRDEIPDVVVPETERVQIADLRDNQCRYIFGDPKQTDHYYCHRSAEAGLSWCHVHASVVSETTNDRASRAPAGAFVLRRAIPARRGVNLPSGALRERQEEEV